MCKLVRVPSYSTADRRAPVSQHFLRLARAASIDKTQWVECHVRVERFHFKPQVPKDRFGVGVKVYDTMFGSLSEDITNPLHRIAVANSSFSLDATVGCPTKCAYCVRGSNLQDLLVERTEQGEYQLNDRFFFSRPKKLFSGTQLVYALTELPFFVPNKSVISISTGSSEPFHGESSTATWLCCIIHLALLSHKKAVVRVKIRKLQGLTTKYGLKKGRNYATKPCNIRNT